MNLTLCFNSWTAPVNNTNNFFLPLRFINLQGTEGRSRYASLFYKNTPEIDKRTCLLPFYINKNNITIGTSHESKYSCSTHPMKMVPFLIPRRRKRGNEHLSFLPTEIKRALKMTHLIKLSLYIPINPMKIRHFFYLLIQCRYHTFQS